MIRPNLTLSSVSFPLLKLAITVFLWVISCVCLGQKTTAERPDEVIEPDPYRRAYFEDFTDYSGVKEISSIARHKYNSFRPDTMIKRVFDAHGNQIRRISFDDNVSTDTTYYTYYPNAALKTWEMVEAHSSLLTQYEYTPAGAFAKTRQLRIRTKDGQSDSTLQSTKAFTYTDGLMTQIVSNETLIERYEYADGQLIYKKGGYIAKAFINNDKGKLIRLNEYMGGVIEEARLMAYKSYTYDAKDRLVLDSVLTSSNMADRRYQITSYGYNEAGQLSSVKVEYDEFYRYVEFEYKEDRLSTVYISTNRSNSAYLRHWISHRIEGFYTFPLKIKEVFAYDDRGNKISKKIYVNEDLFSENEFSIQYVD